MSVGAVMILFCSHYAHLFPSFSFELLFLVHYFMCSVVYSCLVIDVLLSVATLLRFFIYFQCSKVLIDTSLVRLLWCCLIGIFHIPFL